MKVSLPVEDRVAGFGMVVESFRKQHDRAQVHGPSPEIREQLALDAHFEAQRRSAKKQLAQGDERKKIPVSHAWQSKVLESSHARPGRLKLRLTPIRNDDDHETPESCSLAWVCAVSPDYGSQHL